MMTMRILALLSTLLAISGIHADEILIIAGHDTRLGNVSNKHLENIFLRKSLLGENGVSWIPLNLNPDDPIRLAFSQALFNRSPDALESFWNEQYFHGITPPYVVASEEAMLRFVSSTRGAIGYILPCHLDDRVQIIYKLPTKIPLKHYCNKPSP
jgi:hypothetical protein